MNLELNNNNNKKNNNKNNNHYFPFHSIPFIFLLLNIDVFHHANNNRIINEIHK